MQYRLLDEQLKKTIEILNNNVQLMDILNYVSTLNLPNYYIAAGSVFQTF